MHITLGVAFGMIVIAPLLGRWRANVWLKENICKRTIVHLLEPEMRKRNF